MSIPNAEIKCEVMAKHAVSPDLKSVMFKEKDINESEIVRNYTIKLFNLFLVIQDDDIWKGELFLPAYSNQGKGLSQDFKFNLFFRVRDSRGFDVSFKPPERQRKLLRQSMEASFKSFNDQLAQVRSNGAIPQPKPMDCFIGVDEKVSAIVALENQYLNIYMESTETLLDQIDLSEPNVQIDGFSGFYKPNKKPLIHIYAEEQLRLTLVFKVFDLENIHNIMLSVALRCAKYGEYTKGSFLLEKMATNSLKIGQEDDHLATSSNNENGKEIKKKVTIAKNNHFSSYPLGNEPETIALPLDSMQSNINNPKNLFLPKTGESNRMTASASLLMVASKLNKAQEDIRNQSKTKTMYVDSNLILKQQESSTVSENDETSTETEPTKQVNIVEESGKIKEAKAKIAIQEKDKKILEMTNEDIQQLVVITRSQLMKSFREELRNDLVEYSRNEDVLNKVEVENLFDNQNNVFISFKSNFDDLNYKKNIIICDENSQKFEKESYENTSNEEEISYSSSDESISQEKKSDEEQKNKIQEKKNRIKSLIQNFISDQSNVDIFLNKIAKIMTNEVLFEFNNEKFFEFFDKNLENDSDTNNLILIFILGTDEMKKERTFCNLLKQAYHHNHLPYIFMFFFNYISRVDFEENSFDFAQNSFFEDDELLMKLIQATINLLNENKK